MPRKSKTDMIVIEYYDFLGYYSGYVQYDSKLKQCYWCLYFISHQNGCLFSGWADTKKDAIRSLKEKAKQFGVLDGRDKSI